MTFLSSEELIRFKRTLLKPKEILYKDQNIEVGCLTQLLDSNRIKVCLVVTNRTDSPLNSYQSLVTSPKGVVHEVKGDDKRVIKPFEQQKQTHVFKVDELAF